MNVNKKMVISIILLMVLPMNVSAMAFNVDGVDINVNEWDIDIDWKNTDVIISISTTITNTLYRDATIEYSGEKVLVLARSTCDTLTIVTIDMFGRNTDIKWERTSPIKMLDSTKHTGEQEITISQTDTQQQFRKTWYPEPSEEVYAESEESETPEIATPKPVYAESGGAKITGTAPRNSTAHISARIHTKTGDVIEWRGSAATTSDGTVILIAPYPTDYNSPDWDQFDAVAVSMYTVTIAGISHHVSVTEDDVLDRNTIVVT